MYLWNGQRVTKLTYKRRSSRLRRAAKDAGFLWLMQGDGAPKLSLREITDIAALIEDEMVYEIHVIEDNSIYEKFSNNPNNQDAGQN